MHKNLRKASLTSFGVLTYAKAFFSGTILSRISGMFRDIFLAMFFGTGGFLASFMVAFRFANLFRRLFAESALSSSFVPLLEAKKKQSLKESSFFFRDIFFLLCLIGCGVVFFLEATVFLSSYFLKKSIFFEIVPLVHIMLPSLILLMLYGLCSAYLQCHGKYFIGAFAPVVFNGTWCLFAFLAKDTAPSFAMRFLSWGVNIAFLFQLLLTGFIASKSLLKVLSKHEIFARIKFKDSLKEVSGPYFLGMIGISAMQINTFLDSFFAKVADVSGPAYLWYAIRIQQVPLSLFSIALASASLPIFSRLIKQSNKKAFEKCVTETLRKNIVLQSFSSVGLFILGFMVLRLVFFRGAFDSLSLSMTLKCFWGYLLGLAFHGSVIILCQAYYALSDFKTPMKASLLSVLCNLICNIIFVFVINLGAVSIALATSISSIFQFFYLQQKLKKTMKLELFSFSLGTFTLCCFAAVFPVIFYFLNGDPSFLVLKTLGSYSHVLSFSQTLWHFLCGASLFSGAFFLGAKVVSFEEPFMFFKKESLE